MSALKNTASPEKDLSEFDRTSWKESPEPEVPKAGWGPFPYQFFDDLPRLTRGNVQAWLLMYLCRLTFGLEPSRRDDDWPQWTPWAKWSDLAERVHCTVRAVQEEAHEAAKRTGGGLIDIQERRGQVRFRLKWKTWGKLLDYSEVPRPVLVVDNKKPVPKLLEVPFTVRAGRKSRPIAIPGWGKEIAFKGGATDCAVALFLESDSRLLVETAPPCEIEPTLKTKAEAKQNRSHGADSIAQSSPVKKTEVVKKEPASSVPKPLAHACAMFGLTDDGVILQMVVDCQSYAPECSLDDIGMVVIRIGKSISDKVKNKVPIILKQVPIYFNSTAYREGIGFPDAETPTLDELRGLDAKGRRIVERVNAMRRARGEKI